MDGDAAFEPGPDRGRLRIALITAALDRHARELITAFADHGTEAVPLELAECSFDSESPHGLALPGFGSALPDAVCVRTMDGGTFEQVTRRLGVLHGLEALGVPVSNSAASIERCVDKAATSFHLSRCSLPSPRSWAVEDLEETKRIVELEASAAPLVLKPLFGAQGKGLRLVHSVADLPPPEEPGIAGVYYLQRFCGAFEDGTYKDMRILVSNGRAVAGMVRRARTWITNIKQGAEALPLEPDRELEDLAVAAAEAVGADFCGVDLIRGRDGRAWLIEVNSMPAWTGLKRATGLDIAAIRARDLLVRLTARAVP